MALAILELLDFDRAHVRFRIDTGTNRYYQLKVGRAVERRHGLDWVEEVGFATDLSVNEAGGGLFNSSKEISVPAPRFGVGRAYAQLFSFKTAEGRSPAFSSVVRVPLGAGLPAGAPTDLAPSFSRATAMNTTYSFQEPRRIRCRTYGEVYARQASLEEPPSWLAAPAAARGLWPDNGASSSLSSRAVITFEAAEPLAWDGGRKLLFARNRGLQLKVRLSVAEPAPKAPLPKAILKFVFRDGAGQAVLFEKSFRQKDVQANSTMAFEFTQEETARLPAGRCVSVLAEMRWLTKAGKEYKALGSTEVVLVEKYFLKEQGGAVSAEKELADMKRFRPFWNKIWEAPTLSRTGGDDNRKYLWELNVGAKYSVLLSAAHEANGLMETKVLRGEADEEGLSDKTEGRMKAGIELSVAELNKLLPLWDGEAALDRDRLAAFNTDAFVRNNAAEFVYSFKLKGRAGERGMVWVAPVFKLFECTLSAVSKTDDAGQVVDLTEEKVRFPLPVAARVIGLKSER